MFLEFLKENWKIICEFLILLVSLLIIIFRKKIKINIPEETLTQLMVYIPEWITLAEKEIGSGHGKEKLDFVLNRALTYVCNSMSLALKDIPGSLILKITDMIESVLLAPQKKGDTFDEIR